MLWQRWRCRTCAAAKYTFVFCTSMQLRKSRWPSHRSGQISTCAEAPSHEASSHGASAEGQADHDTAHRKSLIPASSSFVPSCSRFVQTAKRAVRSCLVPRV